VAEVTRLLIIEDDLPIRRFLKASLDPAEYELLEAETGNDGMRATALSNPQVVLLDLGLPDIDGVDVVKGLREWTQVPIIVLSARGHEKDKVDALDAGADDYLTKPFAVGELLARIRVAVRRSGREKVAEPIFEHGDLRVDFASRQVTRGAAQVHLTPNEYRLLTVLVRHAGQVVTHKQLLSEVWGAEYAEESHYLRVYMGQLRHKLEADPARPQMLINEPGVGYRFRVE
jgi:two-component system, OmpR family, KDP operon response regulator KdpE